MSSFGTYHQQGDFPRQYLLRGEFFGWVFAFLLLFSLEMFKRGHVSYLLISPISYISSFYWRCNHFELTEMDNQTAEEDSQAKVTFVSEDVHEF